MIEVTVHFKDHPTTSFVCQVIDSIGESTGTLGLYLNDKLVYVISPHSYHYMEVRDMTVPNTTLQEDPQISLH
jgi:hypothetical protein